MGRGATDYTQNRNMRKATSVQRVALKVITCKTDQKEETKMLVVKKRGTRPTPNIKYCKGYLEQEGSWSPCADCESYDKCSKIRLPKKKKKSKKGKR